MKITHLTFIDIETTALDGPDSNTDAIIELAAARVRLSDRVVEDSFEALIKPWGPQSGITGMRKNWEDGTPDWILGDYHTKNGHFADVDWYMGINHVDALDVLLTFVKDGVIIAGQNPRFDLRYLHRDVEGLGWTWPKLDYHIIDLCSPAMFLVIAGLTQGVSLKNTLTWAEPGRVQKHRAMSDVNDAITVFWAMYDYFTGTDMLPEDPIPYVLRP